MPVTGEKVISPLLGTLRITGLKFLYKLTIIVIRNQCYLISKS